MNIFNEDETLPQEPMNPNIRAEPLRDISVDTKYTPRRMLITHIEGYKWVVDYYSQFLGQDTELSPQQINRHEVYQQYLNIREFEMRVQSPLQQSQDSSNKEFTYTGSAAVYPGVTVNTGDMFIADIGDGRQGIFVVNNVEQKSILRDTSYVIEYSLKDFVTPLLLEDLKRKVSKTVTFVKDFYLYGKNPLLVDSELRNYDTVKLQLSELSQLFFGLFYNVNHATFLLPIPNETIYDPYVTSVMKRLVAVEIDPRYRQVKVLNVDRADKYHHFTVWDALLERKLSILDHCFTKATPIPTGVFPSIPLLGSIRFSGIRRCIQGTRGGVERLTNASSPKFNRQIDLGTVYTGDAAKRVYPEDIEPTLDPDNLTKNIVTAYTQSDFDEYVFSSHFYLGDEPNMSEIERMAYAFLKSDTINLPNLIKMTESVKLMNLLDQFYYIPLLLILLNDVVKEIN